MDFEPRSNPWAPRRQLQVWCKNHLSFIGCVRLTKPLACFTSVVTVFKQYPPSSRACTWQVSGSLGTNLQVSCFCTTRQVSIALASLGAQLVKNPPVMQDTWVQPLAWEDPLEKGIGYPLQYSWASLVAQLVKNLPAMQETWV